MILVALMLSGVVVNAQLSIEKCVCSGKYPDACKNAVDGNNSSIWNSGDYAPQWIKLTLDVPHSITKITWINEITPNGEVSMEFKFYNEDGELISTKNKTFDCENGQTNNATFTDLVKVKVVKVTVTKSPSWVALREISLF